MGIISTDLAQTYQSLRLHIGHTIEIVGYAVRDDGLTRDSVRPSNIAIECQTCNEILYDVRAPLDDVSGPLGDIWL